MLLTAMAVAPAAAERQAVSVHGYGTDHGVGLSQRGAAGRAQAGQTYDAILQALLLQDAAWTWSRRTRSSGRSWSRATAPRTRRPDSSTGRTVRKGSDGSRMRWSVDTPDKAVRGQTYPQALEPGAQGPRHDGALGTWRSRTARVRSRSSSRTRMRDSRSGRFHQPVSMIPSAPEGAHPADRQVRHISGRPSASAAATVASGSSTSCPSSPSCVRSPPRRSGRPTSRRRSRPRPSSPAATSSPGSAQHGLARLRRRGLSRQPVVQGHPRARMPTVSHGRRCHGLPGRRRTRGRTTPGPSRGPSITRSGVARPRRPRTCSRARTASRVPGRPTCAVARTCDAGWRALRREQPRHIAWQHPFADARPALGHPDARTVEPTWATLTSWPIESRADLP